MAKQRTVPIRNSPRPAGRVPFLQWRARVPHTELRHVSWLRALLTAIILSALMWFAIGQVVTHLWL